MWNPGKKHVRVVKRFFLVSRGTISGKNYFLEKVTLFHPSDLERKGKFNSQRRSFTNVVSGSFYVFRGKFSGKQIVLEKHTNFHQFWILKQNSIETSRQNLETMSTLTFKCRVERSSRKSFLLCSKHFGFFELLLEFDGKNLNFFCENTMAGLPKPHFTCPAERFLGKQNIFGKIVLFSVFDCQGEDCDSRKRF